MKAVLEFALPDEAREHALASRIGQLCADLDAFSNYLRSQEKYVDPENRDDLSKVREAWYDIMGRWLE